MVTGQKTVSTHLGSVERDISILHLKTSSFNILHWKNEFPPIFSPYTIARKFVSGFKKRITETTVVSQLLRMHSSLDPSCATQGHNRNLQSASLSYLLTSTLTFALPITYPVLDRYQKVFTRSLQDEEESCNFPNEKKIEESIVLISTSKHDALASHTLTENAIHFKADC